MNLLHEILDTLPSQPVHVRKVVIGVHWTLVSSKYVGLGSTMINEGPHGHAPMQDVGNLHLKSAQELASWILSDNLLEASVGTAAINSLLDIDEKSLETINASEILGRESRGKNLAIVGHFPFVDKLKDLARNCWVLEKRPLGDDFSAEKAGAIIPQADVVAITGTAFANHSIENLLALCRPDAFVVVLGPSTPMAPLLFEHGVSVLSGARVVDEEAAITTIQQGAAFPQVKGIRLISMMRG